MYSDNYSKLFYQKSDGLPGDVIRQWAALVEVIEAGYDDVEPELDNDLSLRAQLEYLLNDTDLRQWPADHERFSGEIAALDARLQALLLENPFYRHHSGKMWWQLILLKKGGVKYCADIYKLYGIRIKQVP